MSDAFTDAGGSYRIGTSGMPSRAAIVNEAKAVYLENKMEPAPKPVRPTYELLSANTDRLLAMAESISEIRRRLVSTIEVARKDCLYDISDIPCTQDLVCRQEDILDIMCGELVIIGEQLGLR